MTKSIAKLTGIDNLISAVKYVRSLKRVQELAELDAHELQQFQLERLKQIVRYAYENVELYNKKFRHAGVSPDDIQKLEDIQKLPITTKDDFKHFYPEGILSKEYRPEDCYLLGTGGSTGTPVKIYMDIDAAIFNFAVSLPKLMARMPEITVCAVVKDFLLKKNVTYLFIVVDKPTAVESLHSRVFWSMKHTVVNSLEPPEVHISEINKRRPKYIYTYPSVMRNICAVVREKHLTVHQPSLIMLVGEVFDAPLRNLIKKTFKSELLDVYGSTEAGYMACECSQHIGMHVLSWKVIVELIGDDNRVVPVGESGKVVITDLFNKATPIIRYEGLGDYAVQKVEPCSCGMCLPLLARVEGRVVDSLVLPDGQVIHPYHLTLALEDVPHISKFQIRQERPDYVKVLLVKDNSVEAKDEIIERRIIERFTSILKNQVRVEVEIVPDIPRPAGSHKYATVISLVGRDRTP
jgi:phenylacetate-CoA ligase